MADLFEERLNLFPVEEWDCYDPRLPKSEDLVRVDPDRAFLANVSRNGIMQPIMVGYDESGWLGLVFGMKRLKAVRILRERGSEINTSNWHYGCLPVTVARIRIEDIEDMRMSENAQRSNNPLSDYVDIRNLLHRGLTHSEIAAKIGKTKTYTQTIEKKFNNLPQWVLDNALLGKIAVTTCEKLATLSDSEKLRAKEIFDEKKVLSMADVSNLKRVMKQGFSLDLAKSQGMPQALMARDFYSRTEIETIYNMFSEGYTLDQIRTALSLLLNS